MCSTDEEKSKLRVRDHGVCTFPENTFDLAGCGVRRDVGQDAVHTDAGVNVEVFSVAFCYGDLV